MAKTFAQMKSNVGNFVQDTSAPFSVLIANWINDKYRDIARRTNWSALIDFNYTINLIAGTQEYNLPTDFEQELFVANTTDGAKLNRYSEGGWFEERYGAFGGGTIASGTPSRYVILEETGKVLFDPKPDAVKVIAFPYKKTIAELSGDTETTYIKDIEFIIECGAIHEALAYKKQYQKADYYLQKYEKELATRIGQEKNKLNQTLQRISSSYDVSAVRRMTGDTPYA